MYELSEDGDVAELRQRIDAGTNIDEPNSLDVSYYSPSAFYSLSRLSVCVCVSFDERRPDVTRTSRRNGVHRKSLTTQIL